MLDSTESGSEGCSSLLRQLAHEMRDALSPLASSADLARLRDFDREASRQLAEKVERGLRRALAILDTFVLAEQCETGTLQLAMSRLPLEQIVQSARDALAEPERARCRFVSGEAITAVHADPVRSAQALATVLQHAAAAGPPDSPVDVRIGGSAALPQIHVRGGINPKTAPGEEWFVTWRSGETGMPLQMARHLMRLQRGDVQLVTGQRGEWELVMSFAGVGIPADELRHERFQPREAESAQADPQSGAARSTILIVDDSREVRRAYREALVALGYRVVEAADADLALRALDEAVPEVALIDIHLPRMNGYRLARLIRTRAGPAIYLVMLSGMALDAVTRDLAREAGFDECLDKMAGPIALRELLVAGRDRSQ
jgi:CheY-like chemotaxis protein